MANTAELMKLQREKAEAKLKRYQDEEKAIKARIARLTKNERTHRLCTRAGMLETFLREPTLLTNDDVMTLLTFIFKIDSVNKKLDSLISTRQQEAVDDGATEENPT